MHRPRKTFSVISSRPTVFSWLSWPPGLPPGSLNEAGAMVNAVGEAGGAFKLNCFQGLHGAPGLLLRFPGFPLALLVLPGSLLACLAVPDKLEEPGGEPGADRRSLQVNARSPKTF